MRTIAGQIQKYNFSSANAGVNDPTYGNNVEAIFEAQWQALIANTANNPTTEAGSFGGNEHVGASFNGISPFPDLQDDIPVQAGSALSFEYPVDVPISVLNGLWIIITVQNGRVRTNNLSPLFESYGVQPDASAPIQLLSVTVTGSSDSWTTTLKGTYHTPAHLPNIPFTLAFQESITVLGTIPASFSLQYSASAPTLIADTKDFDRALTALEVGAALFGASLLGIFATPLLAYGVGEVNEYLASQLQPISGSLGLLQDVVNQIPQRIRLTGTKDNLWLHYDSLAMPQGTIAVSSGYDGVNSQVPGAPLVFSGRSSPTRAARIAFVEITGPASVILPVIQGGAGSSNPIPVTRDYSAWANDEVQNPTFKWSIARLSGQGIPSIAVGDPNQQSTFLLFNNNREITPAGTYVLTVHMDDDLHLKDQFGNSPSATLHIVVTHQTIATSKPGRPPRPLTPISE